MKDEYKLLQQNWMKKNQKKFQSSKLNENKNTTYNNLQETNKRFIRRNITQYAYTTKIEWSQINNLMKALEKKNNQKGRDNQNHS